MEKISTIKLFKKQKTKQKSTYILIHLIYINFQIHNLRINNFFLREKKEKLVNIVKKAVIVHKTKYHSFMLKLQKNVVP